MSLGDVAVSAAGDSGEVRELREFSEAFHKKASFPFTKYDQQNFFHLLGHQEQL